MGPFLILTDSSREKESGLWKSEHTALRVIEDQAEIEECIRIRFTEGLNAGIEKKEGVRENPEILSIVMGSWLIFSGSIRRGGRSVTKKQAAIDKHVAYGDCLRMSAGCEKQGCVDVEIAQMKKSCSIPEDLIAPCGMNCAICSRHLSFVNDLKLGQCPGCRLDNKNCTYLFAKCSGINRACKGNKAAVFCFTCGRYPCKQIDRMDARYKKNYGMSVKDNLEYIRKQGAEQFAKEQYKKYRCPKCGGMISVHNRKCFACDRVTRLVEKLES